MTHIPFPTSLFLVILFTFLSSFHALPASAISIPSPDPQPFNHASNTHNFKRSPPSSSPPSLTPVSNNNTTSPTVGRPNIPTLYGRGRVSYDRAFHEQRPFYEMISLNVAHLPPPGQRLTLTYRGLGDWGSSTMQLNIEWWYNGVKHGRRFMEGQSLNHQGNIVQGVWHTDMPKVVVEPHAYSRFEPLPKIEWAAVNLVPPFVKENLGKGWYLEAELTDWVDPESRS